MSVVQASDPQDVPQDVPEGLVAWRTKNLTQAERSAILYDLLQNQKGPMKFVSM